MDSKSQDETLDSKSQDETSLSELHRNFNDRELALVNHFVDPESPGYQNKTRSAELAGYKGAPGSNQLAVQGCRTVKKAREDATLREILDAKAAP